MEGNLMTWDVLWSPLTFHSALSLFPGWPFVRGILVQGSSPEGHRSRKSVDGTQETCELGRGKVTSLSSPTSNWNLAFPSNYRCGQHDTGRPAEPVPLSPVEIRDIFTSHDNFVVILERPFMVITASKLGKLLDLPTDLNAWMKKHIYYYITRFLKYLITVFQ